MTTTAKTRREMVELRDALIRARNAPCDCQSHGADHTFRCIMGGRLMDSAIDAINWCLGEAAPGGSNDRLLAAARRGDV